MKTCLLFARISLTFIIYMTLSTAGHAQWQWARNASLVGNVSPGKAACATAGIVYIAGSFVANNTCTFGSVTLDDSNLSLRMYLAKYDSLGNVLWAKGGGGDSNCLASGTSVATDRWDNVYVVGSYTNYYFDLGDTIIYNTDTTVGDNSSDIFIVKYNANGQLIWARDAGGRGNDYPTGIAIDTAGSLFVCGYYSSLKMMFGNDTLHYPKNTNLNGGGSDIFVAKYDSAGTVLWAKDFHGAGNKIDRLISCATDAQGNLVIGGYFDDSTLVWALPLLQT